MFFEGLFLVSVAIVFFLSKLITNTISQLFLHVTKKHAIAIRVLAILFLPGVIVHELSHALMAGVLFVPVHTIEFMPAIHGNYVKLGSVSIAKTDPIRKFFIGVAPVLFGLLILFSVYFLMPLSLTRLDWKFLLFLLTLFEVGNTMFSSRRDLEGTLTLLAGIVCAAIVFYLVGFRIPPGFFTFLLSPRAVQFFQTIDTALWTLILIDIFMWLIVSWGIRKLFQK